MAMFESFGHPLGQLLIYRSTVTYGHQADDSCLPVHGIDDAKAENAIFV